MRVFIIILLKSWTQVNKECRLNRDHLPGGQKLASNEQPGSVNEAYLYPLLHSCEIVKLGMILK